MTEALDCVVVDVQCDYSKRNLGNMRTGEVEMGGASVAGLAVHIGARVAATARDSEVLVSHTVKDLVAGSGIQFEDRGPQILKGVPGEWHLYAVVMHQQD